MLPDISVCWPRSGLVCPVYHWRAHAPVSRNLSPGCCWWTALNQVWSSELCNKERDWGDWALVATQPAQYWPHCTLYSIVLYTADLAGSVRVYSGVMGLGQELVTSPGPADEWLYHYLHQPCNCCLDDGLPNTGDKLGSDDQTLFFSNKESYSIAVSCWYFKEKNKDFN